MDRIIDFCNYLYNAHHIPIYIYKNEEIITCFPEQPKCCHPTSDFKEYILNTGTFLCYITSESLFMGYITVNEYNLEILLGPVNAISYTESQLSQLLFRKKIGKTDHEACLKLFNSVPIHSHLEFIDIVLLLQFALTGEKITRDEFFRHQDNTIIDTPRNTFIQQQPDSEPNPFYLRSNNIILQYIENGDSDAVFQYLCSQNTPPAVDFGHTPLEQRKHLGYYSVALFSDAAERGGLSVIECTEIAASYYKDISASSSIEKIDFLTGRAALFYANKVASVNLPLNINSTLLNCIQFVRHNVYNHIQVSDIASYIGYCRVHVSRLFKQELGFGPGQLILRTKLEEAKILLRHTDKSLSEISTALCFANQSHFHRSFKAQFQITPMEYKQKSK